MRRQSFETVLLGPRLLVREGLMRILRSAGFQIIASDSCPDDLHKGSLPRQQALLIVLDAGHEPDVAVAQIETIKRQVPAGRIAVLVDHCSLHDVSAAYRAGASAYFVKVAANAAFIKSLELVMLGETLFPPLILPLIIDHTDPSKDRASEPAHIVEPGRSPSLCPDDDMPMLSVREQGILRCLVEGHTNKVIARKAEIAEATVKIHVKAILRKIRVRNRTQAAIWAINNGFSSVAGIDRNAPDAGASDPLLLNGISTHTELLGAKASAERHGVMQHGIGRKEH